MDLPTETLTVLVYVSLALNAVLLVFLGWGIIAFFPSRDTLGKTLDRAFPAGAVAYFKDHPVPGCVFNEVTWGGYLIWTRGAEARVFIDGRADVYEYGGILADYIRIMGLDQNSLQLLRRHNIQACLLVRNSPLGTLLTTQPEWKQVYADNLSAIFVRKPGLASALMGNSPLSGPRRTPNAQPAGNATPSDKP